MKHVSTRSLVLLACLAAWSILLRLVDFPLLPAAPFLKMDLSDLLVFLAMWVQGPKGMLAVALLRDLAGYLMRGGEMGLPLGAIMSLTASLAMFLPVHYVLVYFRQAASWVKYGFASVSLILGLTLSMALMNYYLALPIYSTLLEFPIGDFRAYIMAVVVPFNLIKGGILSGCLAILAGALKPLLLRKSWIYPAYLPESLPVHYGKQVPAKQCKQP